MYILDSPTEGMTRKIILMNTDPVDDMSQQSVLVTFESGVAVKVANVGGYMNVVAVAPPSFWVGHLYAWIKEYAPGKHRHVAMISGIEHTQYLFT